MKLYPLLALLLTLVSGAGAAPSRNNLAAIDGEVIVRFKADADLLRKHALSTRAAPAQVSEVLAGRAAALGARVGRVLETGAPVGDRTQVLRARGISAQMLAAQLTADSDVEFAEPNGRKRRLVAPNDPLYAATAPGVRPSGPDSGQWYLRAPSAGVVSGINIEAAWARTTGSGNVVVAVLDTGVRADHPDLVGRLVAGYDFVSNAAVANDGDGRDPDASDPGDWVTSAEAGSSPFTNCTAENSSWHGTATASLVGAASQDGIGMAGVAPGIRVQPVRVLGKCFGSDSDIQAAMRWAAGISVAGVPDNPTPAKVINLSLGGTGACSASYQAVVNEILARGVVVVAAAGNSAGHPVGTPANCNGVVAVLALRHAGTKVGFSDLGSQITIAAPGGNCINVTAGSPCLYPIVAATNAGSQAPAASGWTDGFKISVGTSFAS
ncbi:MAG TPA: S8 family serine peptidase, partial [Rubrivivax sp.]|nr:S8 family serine peptidase [Rubrivivax sp.]